MSFLDDDVPEAIYIELPPILRKAAWARIRAARRERKEENRLRRLSKRERKRLAKETDRESKLSLLSSEKEMARSEDRAIAGEASG